MLEDTLDGRTVLIQVVSLQTGDGEEVSSSNPLPVSTERLGALNTVGLQSQILEVLKDIRFHLREINGEEEEH